MFSHNKVEQPLRKLVDQSKDKVTTERERANDTDQKLTKVYFFYFFRMVYIFFMNLFCVWHIQLNLKESHFYRRNMKCLLRTDKKQSL